MSVHIKVSRTNTKAVEAEGLTSQPAKMGRWSKKTSKKQGQASHSKDSKARKWRRAFGWWNNDGHQEEGTDWTEIFPVTHRQCTHPFTPLSQTVSRFSCHLGGQVEAKGEQAGAEDILSQRGRFQTQSLSGSPEQPWLSLTLPLPVPPWSLLGSSTETRGVCFTAKAPSAQLTMKWMGLDRMKWPVPIPVILLVTVWGQDFQVISAYSSSVQMRRLN